MSEVQEAEPLWQAGAIERSFERPLLSVVVCTLDEAQSIGPVLDELREALAGIAHEVVVVDDSVDERTATVVLTHAATNERVRLLRRKGENGLASAAIDGWDVARGDVLAIMDGDGQHDPHLLPLMLDRLNGTSADMLVASRYAGEGPSGLKGRRHLVSRMGTLLTQVMLGVRSTDPLSGLFMVTRDWFKEARPNLSGVGFKILVDIMASGRCPPSSSRSAPPSGPAAPASRSSTPASFWSLRPCSWRNARRASFRRASASSLRSDRRASRFIWRRWRC